MERTRNAVAIVVGIATILAASPAIFPDTFVIRGTLPLGSVLRAVVRPGFAIPVAIVCGLALAIASTIQNWPVI